MRAPSATITAVLNFVICVLTGLTAQAQQSPVPLEDLAPEYHRCHEILWSPPMTTLGELVKERLGARISTSFLGKNLTNVRCTDDQITEYMEHHGLLFLGIEELPDVVHFFGGRFDRRIYFCQPSLSLIDRIIAGKCNAGAEFMMLGDKVSFISGGGSKNSRG